jgi:zinc protease
MMQFVSTANAEDPPTKVASVEGITEFRLANGLRVLLFPDPTRPRVTVNLTVFVGSRHEGYGESGMAHLLEHMVFKGTPTFPHIPQALQQRGAQFNGTTSVDRTNYFETLAASDDNLEFAIQLEADRMVNSYIKREDLISEMTVVRNEFERGENSPSSVLAKRIMSAAFEWHNYGKTTIGNRSDIERVPIENLQAFYRKHYQPDNAMLVVAGKFDQSKALELIQKYFGAIPRPDRKLDKTYTEEPEQDGERVVTLRRVGDVGVIGAVYHIPAVSHADFPALQVLGNILTTPPSGRLYRELVETKIATSAGAFARAMHDPGIFSVDAEVGKDSSIESVRDQLLSLVEGIGETGVSDQEVERAKQQLLKARELAATNTSQLAVSLSEWSAQGDWRLYFLNRDRLETVSKDDVRRVAARYLVRNNRTVGIYIPTDAPQRVPIPSTPDINSLVESYQGRAAIAAGEEFDYSYESLERNTVFQTIGGGIKLAMLPKKNRGEEVNATIVLRYGDEANLRGLNEAASYLMPLMMRGTRQMTRQQILDELNRLKANLGGGGGGGRRGRGGGGGGGGGLGSLSFSIQTKRESLPEVLKILRQVLREPLLPESDFEIMKQERLANLEQSRSEPTTLGSRALGREFAPYAPDDVRYVPSIEEEIARNRAVTIEHIRRLYRDYLGGQHGEIAIVGDFDPADCLPVLNETFNGWTAQQPYARIPRPLESSTGKALSINTPDKANATYLAGCLLKIQESDEEYPAMSLANFIFGGGSLSSRLGDRVRQKEGLSYSVSSSFSASSFEPRATFTISAIYNPENRDQVTRVVREEIDRMLQSGVSSDELLRAKSGYLEQRRVSRSSDAAVVGMLVGMLYENRDLGAQRELEAKIESLTTDQVAAVFRRYLDPKNLVIVTAGDFGRKAAASGSQ